MFNYIIRIPYNRINQYINKQQTIFCSKSSILPANNNMAIAIIKSETETKIFFFLYKELQKGILQVYR